MDHQQKNETNFWRHVRAAFPDRPTDDSELFVESVMSRLEKPAMPLGWLVPVFGAIVLALTLHLTHPATENLPTSDNLILTAGGGTTGQWVISEEEPQADELVGIELEVL